MAEKARVLVVDDDPEILSVISASLTPEGFDVRSEGDVTDAQRVAQAFRPDVVVLDVLFDGMPKGLDLARHLRAEDGVGLLLLSGDGSTQTRLDGFEAGADDYVTKPLLMSELVARVRALVRRSGHDDNAVWVVGDLVIDSGARTIVLKDEELEFTKTEFDVLLALLRHRGRVVSKQELLAEVWDFDAYDPNLVEVHVSALRRKLGPEFGDLIRTVRGVGYIVRHAAQRR